MNYVCIDGGGTKVQAARVKINSSNSIDIIEPIIERKYLEHKSYNPNFIPISIDDQKAKKLEKDLNAIFKWIEQLNELNTDNVEPLTSIAETTLRFRDDKITSENIREKILKNSPEKNDDFFVVPKVVE